jgi:hypothetical protein
MLRRNLIKNLLCLPLLGFLGFSKKTEAASSIPKEISFFNEEFNDSSVFYNDDLKKSIKEAVSEWLKNDTSPKFEMHVLRAQATNLERDKLIFLRSIIKIKAFHNGWQIWETASCAEYHELISIKKELIGINDCPEGLVLNNEVKPQCYNEDSHKSVAWIDNAEKFEVSIRPL